MADGTVYAGISPDTGRTMYTTPKDNRLCVKWNKAMAYAATLEAHGHEDWRVPTAGELAVLFKSRAAIGSFSETDHLTLGWYWSSTQADTYCRWVHCRWIQRFRDGRQNNASENFSASLRCVRG